MATSTKVQIWDLPLRLFHWSFATLLIVAWYSAEIMDDFDLHFVTGYGLLGLLIFRVLWGFCGTHHAKFHTFIRGPKRVLAYLRGREKHLEGGHNPLGALSVICLLGTASLQALSGLFSDDEYYYFGPLNSYISSDLASVMTNFHHLNFNVLATATLLHVLAILYYQFIKKEGLIKPMITGTKEDPSNGYERVEGHYWKRAIICAVGATVITVTIANAGSLF